MDGTHRAFLHYEQPPVKYQGGEKTTFTQLWCKEGGSPDPEQIWLLGKKGTKGYPWAKESQDLLGGPKSLKRT